ncbi:MAG: ABC transporter permease [Bacillota bacterium]|nr:ABC transporter permease [Bacillota bacterium]
MKKNNAPFSVTRNLLGNEKRQAVTIPLLAILLSLIAVSVVILAVGNDPLAVFKSLLQGSGLLPKASYAAKKSMLTDFLSLLNALTPMLFAALAVAIAFKAGLFNIGVSGQMLAAGFVASIVIGYSALGPWLAKPLVILIGLTVGGAVGLLIGFLKHRFNINEVVSSIMLNYIILYVSTFFINTNFVDPVSRQSRYISSASRLTLTDLAVGELKMDIPLGLLLALLTALALKFLLDKTKTGYELKAVGVNRKAAKYAGMAVGRNIMLAMFISGMLAGLAGVTYYLGFYSSIQPRVLTSVGFDAIAVSLLGNSSPIGVIFASFLISVVTKGSTYMSSAVGVEQEIASVIVGLILLFSACGVYIRYLTARSRDRLREQTATAEGAAPAAAVSEKGGDE